MTLLEPYESFYDRLACLPTEEWIEASESDEGEREYGFDDEDGEA